MYTVAQPIRIFQGIFVGAIKNKILFSFLQSVLLVAVQDKVKQILNIKYNCASNLASPFYTQGVFV